MTIEEAIKYLEPIAKNAGLLNYRSALTLALEALRAQQTEKNGYPNWISVRDRLPNDDKKYLCRYGFEKSEKKSRLMFTGSLYYFTNDRNPHWQHVGAGLFVTHWMPLPEPPIEKES